MIYRINGICFAVEDSEVGALRIVWFVDPEVAVVCADEIASSFHSSQRRCGKGFGIASTH